MKLILLELADIDLDKEIITNVKNNLIGMKVFLETLTKGEEKKLLQPPLRC